MANPPRPHSFFLDHLNPQISTSSILTQQVQLPPESQKFYSPYIRRHHGARQPHRSARRARRTCRLLLIRRRSPRPAINFQRPCGEEQIYRLQSLLYVSQHYVDATWLRQALRPCELPILRAIRQTCHRLNLRLPRPHG